MVSVDVAVQTDLVHTCHHLCERKMIATQQRLWLVLNSQFLAVASLND